ncbi:MAG: GGDEF domain-containing protein, partial [Oscillospiraceae bacterium]|nr:GGDEF domain-containing protein [Oscillospiraceae bacterium]
TASIILKIPHFWAFDLVNTAVAAIIGQYFSWQLTKYRIKATLNSIRLQEERDKYRSRSTIDELTQLSNRRDFDVTFNRYLTNYRSSDDVLYVAILDIDHFKAYNDFYGHPQGDDCLRIIGKAFNSLKTKHNIYTARIGGEEFAVLWFEGESPKNEAMIELILETIRGLQIPHEKSQTAPYITMSMGVCVMQCGTKTDTTNVYSLADTALYSAKTQGRNRAVVSDDG